MNLKKELEKMNLSDLRFVCRELLVSCPKNKKNIIKILLLPLKKYYSMDLDIVEEGDDDIPSDWEDDEVMKRIDEKNAAETLQKFMKKYLRLLKLKKNRIKKKSKKRELTKKEKEMKEKNRRIQEHKKKEKERKKKEEEKKKKN